ncbi:hypothetical protein HOH87_06460 [bacterium]|nr:hypothetical protein [bacterium]
MAGLVIGSIQCKKGFVLVEWIVVLFISAVLATGGWMGYRLMGLAQQKSYVFHLGMLLHYSRLVAITSGEDVVCRFNSPYFELVQSEDIVQRSLLPISYDVGIRMSRELGFKPSGTAKRAGSVFIFIGGIERSASVGIGMSGINIKYVR